MQLQKAAEHLSATFNALCCAEGAMCTAPTPLCVVQVPVPTVTQQERLLFQKMPYAGVYRCVVRCECREMPVV